MVTKILVPIDFSACSLAALGVARQIAKKYAHEVCIVLYHGLDPTGYPAESGTVEDNKAIWKEFAHKKMKALQAEVEEDGLQAKCCLSVGNFIDNIKEHCSNNTYELIVMGSHGASGLQELLIGSKTQKVIRKIHERVLIVKEEGLDLTKVLFVSGLGPEDKEPFTVFLKEMQNWGAEEVHLLAINTGGFFSQPTYLMAKLLEDFAAMSELPVITHFINDLSIDKGVQKFAQEEGVGLIGISNKTRHPVKRVLRGSHVETIINHSSVPVLSIDY